MSESVSGAVPSGIPAKPHSREQEPLLWPARVRMQAAVHRHLLALTAILALSAFVNLFQLTNEGYGNTYYAATVKNMLTSWRNFFFVSFDAGFVTVDKPPLAFWIQAASAKVFGFQGWSILLPQAIAGVLSVGLIYHLVRRAMGPVAGWLAAFTLALTPISVAISRHNNLEGLLALSLLLAAWAFVLAAETGRLRWLLLGAVLVGLGFNIKMILAFLVLPAFYLLYLVAAPVGWLKRILHLGLTTAVLLVVSLSWAVAVDLTPPDQRPYVSASSTNTVMDVIVNFYGANRLTGEDKDVGERGPLRLLREPLVGQIGWLVPLAALGLAVAIWQERPPLSRSWRLSRRQQALVLWGTWFITQWVFFSIAGDWDPHYLAVLAPAVAALVGIGVVALWTAYRSPGWLGWMLPVTLAVTAGLQTQVLTSYSDWNSWLRPVVAIVCFAAVAGLIVVRLAPRLRGTNYGLAAAVAGMVALLIAPSFWAASTIWYGGETRTPIAGPRPRNDRGANSQFFRDAEPLLEYLQAHQGTAMYLVASADRDVARYAILQTNEPVIAFGGFNGNDPVLSTTRLAGLVNNGAVRFFVLEETSRESNRAAQWIIQNCQPLPKTAWQPRSGSSDKEAKGIVSPLYDCSPGQGSGVAPAPSPLHRPPEVT
jgi:4-amino-4-deoxy-L-arabinose transferase-like glycosyltransferase